MLDKSKTIKCSFKKKCKRGMTLMEVLIVVSLISMVSLAIYNSLANGLKVWKKSQRYVIEEDILIFFDKLTQDLHNSFHFSLINFQGGELKFSFPTIVKVLADERSHHPRDEYVDQVGRVEYYFSLLDKGIYRRRANYSQAINERYAEPELLVKAIDRFQFRYFYLTDGGENISSGTYEKFPYGVEVEVQFSDNLGQRTIKKFIEIPTGS